VPIFFRRSEESYDVFLLRRRRGCASDGDRCARGDAEEAFGVSVGGVGGII